jgi:hypothetical protein
LIFLDCDLKDETVSEIGRGCEKNETLEILDLCGKKIRVFIIISNANILFLICLFQFVLGNEIKKDAACSIRDYLRINRSLMIYTALPMKF